MPAAIGAAVGIADLHLAHGVHAGHNTLGGFAHDDVVRASLERVPVEPLDAVIARLGLARVDFVKIDVEGAEASVIAGAHAVLEDHAAGRFWWRSTTPPCVPSSNSAELLLATLRDQLDYEVLVFSSITGLAGTARGRRSRCRQTLSPCPGTALPRFSSNDDGYNVGRGSLPRIKVDL